MKKESCGAWGTPTPLDYAGIKIKILSLERGTSLGLTWDSLLRVATTLGSRPSEVLA